MIVPNFDIDLIWQTHIRHSSHYQAVLIDLRDFILDHNDSIEQKILSKHYQKTGDRWKVTSNSNYGHNIDPKHSETSQYSSSYAMVLVPISISDGDGHPSCGTIEGDCESICVGCGDQCGGG